MTVDAMPGIVSQDGAASRVPLRVVFFEDCQADVELAIRELTKAGFDVTSSVVMTPAALAGRLLAGTFDVVLADHRLPGCTSADALEVLKRNGSSVPLILVTGSLGEERAVECLKQGAADYVLKDRLARLPAAVRRAIQQRRLHEERAQAQRELDQFFTLSLEMLCIAGFDGQLKRLNPAWERVLGFTCEELRAKPVLEFVHPEDRPAAVAEFRRLLAEGETTWFEIRCRSKDGSCKWIAVNAAALSDQKLIYAAARDITERKRMEESREKLTKALSRSNAELEQFAYVASHDLQEPLRMVCSYVQLLEKRYRDKLDSTASSYIAFAVDGVKRMQQLIADLLTYSRLTKYDTGVSEAKPVGCEAGFERSLRNLQSAIEECGAVVTHDPLPWVNASESQLLQLFQNLVGNAIKFRGKQTPKIHVSVKESPGEWTFLVRDNGIGIDARDAERVFRIFQRLHTRDEFPGTGMGLAICKKIVEGHGGRIWVESERGKGSTFCFTIPKNKSVSAG